MFGTSTNRASAYARVQVETGVDAADPHKLILMLYDGAIMAISSASHAMQQRDIPTKGRAISKAIEIIANGLDACLDHDAGGDLAGRLSALYNYMTDRLLYANLHNNQAALEEVQGLLHGLRESWDDIREQALHPEQK